MTSTAGLASADEWVPAHGMTVFRWLLALGLVVGVLGFAGTALLNLGGERLALLNSVGVADVIVYFLFVLLGSGLEATNLGLHDRGIVIHGWFDRRKGEEFPWGLVETRFANRDSGRYPVFLGNRASSLFGTVYLTREQALALLRRKPAIS